MADRTWLERIRAVPCTDPGHCRDEDKPCLRIFDAPVFCASRITAAEEAANRPRRVPPHSYERAVGGPGPWKRGTQKCRDCGVVRTYDSKVLARYSRDNGATWTPGPDPCPGRAHPGTGKDRP